jgi:hypothetical protein
MESTRLEVAPEIAAVTGFIYSERCYYFSRDGLLFVKNPGLIHVAKKELVMIMSLLGGWALPMSASIARAVVAPALLPSGSSKIIDV